MTTAAIQSRSLALRTLATLDANADSALSQNEINNSLHSADRNRDGRLSEQELVDVFERPGLAAIRAEYAEAIDATFLAHQAGGSYPLQETEQRIHTANTLQVAAGVSLGAAVALALPLALLLGVFAFIPLAILGAACLGCAIAAGEVRGNARRWATREESDATLEQRHVLDRLLQTANQQPENNLAPNASQPGAES